MVVVLRWVACAVAIAISVTAPVATLELQNRITDDHAVLIPGGTFRMGTAAAAIPALKARYGVSFPGVFENEVPEHTVTLSAFRLDRYEVTGVDGRPMASVTWNAAQKYCRSRGGRLPTEAEWEYAARGGTDAEFPWGNELPSPRLANYGRSDRREAVVPGTYPPNRFGLYDLAGNVWEFVLDAWEPTYPSEPQANPIAAGPVADDQIDAIIGRRAIRGGSYDGSVVNLRTRWRDSHPAGNAVPFVGFRCAYRETSDAS